MSVNSLNHGADLPPDEVTDEDLAFIAQALPPLAPPPQVQARVLARINERIAGLDAPAEAATDWRTLRRDAGVWRAIADDVDIKLLHEGGGFTTLLVRMQAGARLPPHTHAGKEECYVVSGDVWLSGVHLQAGDFHLADGDLVHDDIHSESGCLLHIRACGESAALGL